MSPGTPGSATPISLGPDNQQPDSAAKNKIMEDTKAYMRSLAQYHERNVELASGYHRCYKLNLKRLIKIMQLIS